MELSYKQLAIVAENEDFIVINKPSGLLSIPDRFGKELSLKIVLENHFGKGNIFTVHRLDKDTSGLIVFAKTAESHKELSALFEGREVTKIYVGLVQGLFAQTSGTITAAIMEHPGKNGKMVTHAKGKTAITDYLVLESFKNYSWMQFQIHTGKTHQIRLHMQHIGHSIVCDELYGDGKPILLSTLKKKFKLAKKEDEERPILARLGLHSHQLSFAYGNEQFSFEAPVPKDIKALLQQLSKV